MESWGGTCTSMYTHWKQNRFKRAISLELGTTLLIYMPLDKILNSFLITCNHKVILLNESVQQLVINVQKYFIYE